MRSKPTPVGGGCQLEMPQRTACAGLSVPLPSASSPPQAKSVRGAGPVERAPMEIGIVMKAPGPEYLARETPASGVLAHPQGGRDGS